MSSLSKHDHLNPNDPAYYAPARLRERAKPEPVSAPISPPASLDVGLENAMSSALWRPLNPEVFHEPDGLAREDRRRALISLGARFALAVGVCAVVALFFVVMVPASRQSDAGSISSEITGSTRTPPPQSGQGNDGSKPALAAFQAILAAAPPSQSATDEQSEQLLQKFLKWRQKPNSTETSQ
jgi:hypothetical protein